MRTGGSNPSETPVRVLYIMGAGRSGSTILDIVLGNHPGVESVGELTNLPYSGWIGGKPTRTPYCACGRLVIDCPFWSAVRREWIDRIGPEDVADLPTLQSDFERYRRLPRLLRERVSPSPRFVRYAAFNRALFQAIRAVSGRDVVVDSSKSPLRALALATVPGIDLRAIHLVRDGRGVISSQKKSFEADAKAGLPRGARARPAWISGAFWLGFNLLSEWVRYRLGLGKSLRVVYEAFAADPEPLLIAIWHLARLEGAEPAATSKALEVGHNVGGNRLRMSKDIKLRPDAGAWSNTLSEKERRLSWVAIGWLLRRYGYRK